MMNDAKRHPSIGWVLTTLLFLAVALVGCQDKPNPAPQATGPEKVASAPAQTKTPPPPAAEGAEMLTPTEMRAVHKIYEAQARQTINAQNAEAIANALAKEIESDIATGQDSAIESN